MHNRPTSVHDIRRCTTLVYRGADYSIWMYIVDQGPGPQENGAEYAHASWYPVWDLRRGAYLVRFTRILWNIGIEGYNMIVEYTLCDPGAVLHDYHSSNGFINTGKWPMRLVAKRRVKRNSVRGESSGCASVGCNSKTVYTPAFYGIEDFFNRWHLASFSPCEPS